MMKPTEIHSFTNHFLIAMPSMTDPYFTRTLTLICEHNEHGALGIVVNRPIDLTLESLLGKIDISISGSPYAEMAVHFGGPVQVDRGFVLHQPVGNWQSTLKIQENLGLTTSKDILEAVGNGEGPPNILVTLGYAGWGPGQLELEMKQNSWLTLPADPEILFHTPPEQRLNAAMKHLGINIIHLSGEAGHA